MTGPKSPVVMVQGYLEGTPEARAAIDEVLQNLAANRAAGRTIAVEFAEFQAKKAAEAASAPPPKRPRSR